MGIPLGSGFHPVGASGLVSCQRWSSVSETVVSLTNVLPKQWRVKSISPGGLVSQIRSEIKPNEVCPCGSNKKFKKCCNVKDIEMNFPSAPRELSGAYYSTVATTRLSLTKRATSGQVKSVFDTTLLAIFCASKEGILLG